MYRILDPQYAPVSPKELELRYNAETRRVEPMPVMFVRFVPRPGVRPVHDMEEARRVYGGRPVLEAV